MVCENVVKTLPLLCKIEALEGLEAADLVESYDSSLIKRDQELASRARLGEFDGAQLSIPELNEFRAEDDIVGVCTIRHEACHRCDRSHSFAQLHVLTHDGALMCADSGPAALRFGQHVRCCFA